MDHDGTSTNVAQLHQGPLWCNSCPMAEDQTKLQFRIRMTPEVKAAIVAAAARNNRSINAEILARLEESFQSGRALGIDPKDVEIVDILEELERLKSKVAKLSRKK
ncbi:hypothetical protein DQ393_05925 [Rhizobium tropici]|uniref:Arc-like DNA binding domain-containing protein n=2 Tax=Rhizobium tropici TaxID=398 RepID=A0A329YFN6_RHITR|nr:hypothetical protein DQ393_05925 [Rhizobium tropici]